MTQTQFEEAYKLHTQKEAYQMMLASIKSSEAVHIEFPGAPSLAVHKDGEYDVLFEAIRQTLEDCIAAIDIKIIKL